ncbi:unnamed protein product, partial [Closterium sp. NIES-54]
QVAASSRVSASGQLAASCSCQVLSHQTLLWHHRQGHPSLPRLRSMQSCLLRVAPHSSEFPPTTAPVQTLHMDVWGPAPVGGTDQEHYFLLVVDEYTRYTTFFPLRHKADVSGVLIPWIRATRCLLRERFRRDFLVLRLHSDWGGEFSSGLLEEFCRDEGIRQTFTLPASPQRNGFAKRRIGLSMEVARTSMIHAASPHFLWSFVVRYAAHQLNLWPRSQSLHAFSPTLSESVLLYDTLSPSCFTVWHSRPSSPLPAPTPHTEVTESLTEHREPETRASTLVRARRVARPHPPTVPGTHGMALRPSSVPQHVVLPEPLASSLSHIPDPESNLARAVSPTVTHLLTTVVTDPDFESTAAFALVTELVDFAARSRLDYIATLVTESESVCPPSVGGELALSSDILEDMQFELECLAVTLPHFASMLLCPEGDPDALDIPTPRYYTEAIAGEYSSQWRTAMDTEMAFWKSTDTYVDEVPPPRANIVDGMWIFRVKWPPGTPPAVKARYVARGFNQRQGVDFLPYLLPHPKDDYSSGAASHCSTA